MSTEKKKIEITSPPKSLGGSSLSVGVRFYYPDYPEKGWRGNLTIDAENKAEFKERLKEAWRWKKPKSDADERLDEIKGIADIDWEEP